MNKSSTVTKRISKVVVDLSSASNNSLDQQTNQDDHTEIFSLKDLTRSSDWYEDDLSSVPDQAAYQVPFDSGARDEYENVSIEDLKMLTQKFRSELMDELRDEMKSQKDEMRDQVDGIRDEMKSQLDEIRDELQAQIRRQLSN